jgi:hypothetical protein
MTNNVPPSTQWKHTIQSRNDRRWATRYTQSYAVMWMLMCFGHVTIASIRALTSRFSVMGSTMGLLPRVNWQIAWNCDETISGPGFQTVDARSRRRSGLLSKIVRDCDYLLIVDHTPLCEVTQAKVNARALQGEQSSQRPEQPLRFVPLEPSETCFYIETSLGL